MNEFYTNPYYDADYTSPISGFIPDQNTQQYPYYGPYAPGYQIDDDENTGEDVRLAAQQQLAAYVQQKREQEHQQALNDYYTISAGDTLSKIAAAHGMTYQELARLNGIKNADKIRTGQRLRFNDSINNDYKDYAGIRRTPIHPVARNRSNSNAVNTNKNNRPVNMADDFVVIGKRRTKQNTASSKRKDDANISIRQQISNRPKSLGGVIYNIGRKISSQNQDRRYNLYIYDISHGRVPKNTSFANYLRGLY